MHILTPEETREHSVFTLVGREGAGVGRWLMLGLLAVVGWLGGVAFLGDYRPTQVSRLLATFAPLDQVYWVSLAVAGAIAVGAIVVRRWALGWAAATIAGYLGAFLLFSLLMSQFPPGVALPLTGEDDAWRFALFRLWFAGPIAVVLLVVWLLFRARIGGVDPAFGFGNWLVQSRDFSAKAAPKSYVRELLGGYLVFVLIFAVIAQAPLGFAPVLSGAVLALAVPLVIAAAANAIAEEVVYRGFIQPAFIQYGGAGAGLWVQGLFFGLIHWGLSVGVLAALPTSLLIGVGSVVWGKAAYETRGLGWTIVAHFLIDLVIMAAYFVPH